MKNNQNAAKAFESNGNDSAKESRLNSMVAFSATGQLGLLGCGESGRGAGGMNGMMTSSAAAPHRQPTTLHTTHYSTTASSRNPDTKRVMERVNRLDSIWTFDCTTGLVAIRLLFVFSKGGQVLPLHSPRPGLARPPPPLPAPHRPRSRLFSFSLREAEAVLGTRGGKPVAGRRDEPGPHPSSPPIQS